MRQFRDARDWAKFHTPKDLAISISIEAGELLELFQWKNDGPEPADLDVQRLGEEASDVLLYTLMLFDRLGLDPVAEALRKIDDNAERYPVHRVYGRPGSAVKSRR